jgi:hypothetical protein
VESTVDKTRYSRWKGIIRHLKNVEVSARENRSGGKAMRDRIASRSSNGRSRRAECDFEGRAVCAAALLEGT